MGKIADRVSQMRGCSLREIVEAIAMMEGDLDVGESDFDRFWEAYPYKAAKPGAKKAYRTARRNGHRHQDIMRGLQVYIETKPRDRDWCMASTFLNQERFCDIEVMTSVSAKPKNVADLFGAMEGYFDERSREGSPERASEAALRLAPVQR